MDNFLIIQMKAICGFFFFFINEWNKRARIPLCSFTSFSPIVVCGHLLLKISSTEFFFIFTFSGSHSNHTNQRYFLSFLVLLNYVLILNSQQFKAPYLLDSFSHFFFSSAVNQDSKHLWSQLISNSEEKPSYRET